MSTPPTVAILTIGSELLCGDGVDTNSAWLSQRLEALGLRCLLHASVPDDVGAIVWALDQAAGKGDVVIVTGGLGPTTDDLTRAAVAGYLGVATEVHEPSVEHIRALFARFGRVMPESNRVQADLPVGARVLTNGVGTAPAFAVEKDGVSFYCLPGVPREMRWLWDRYLEGELRARGGTTRAERTFRTVGIAESSLGERLLPLERHEDLEVRYAAEESKGTIRVTLLTDRGEDRCQELWLEARELVGRRLHAEGTDEPSRRWSRGWSPEG